MEKIILFEQKSDCCGCGACMAACSKNAISLKSDENGFIYPVIDKELCVNCGICKNVCGMTIKESFIPQKVYAAATRNKEIILGSASGGVFAAIAQDILLKGGIVVGCSMENEDGRLFPRHIVIDSVEHLNKLQGSKYVQSEIRDDVYVNIKKMLNQGRIVLFSGTPCQVSSLRNFLNNKDYPNLFCIDIICHGVPNIQIFQDYIKYLEKKKGMKINNLRFRDKSVAGWGVNGIVEYSNGTKVVKEKLFVQLSSYYKLFFEGLIYRDSCYSCRFAQQNRVGDLTIGDYWGIEKEHPEYLGKRKDAINEHKGISCVLVNNKKGEEMMNSFSDSLETRISDFSKVAKGNTQLNHPVEKSAQREKILKMYRDGGYEELEKWFNNRPLKKKLKLKIWYNLPLWAKKLIKQIKK